MSRKDYLLCTRRRSRFHQTSLHESKDFFFVNINTHFYKTFFFSAKHCQKSVRRDFVQRFAPVKILGVFLRLFLLFLGFDHFTGNHGLSLKNSSKIFSNENIFVYPFCDDVPRTLKRLLHARNFFIQIILRRLFYITIFLRHNDFCQRFQPFFFCGIGFGFSSFFERKIQVFYLL